MTNLAGDLGICASSCGILVKSITKEERGGEITNINTLKKVKQIRKYLG